MPTTKPRFNYVDYLSPAGSAAPSVVSALQEEIVFPSEWVLQDLLGKPYSSPFESFSVVNGVNDKLRFTYGATSYTVTIPSGTYWIENLCGAITDAMNTAAGVTTILAYVLAGTPPGPYYVAIVRTGASTFSLLCATWTGDTGNKAFSIFPALGFDCSTDKTGIGANTGYSSGYSVSSTWGSVNIATGVNDIFKFNIGAGTLTATVAGGNYSIRALQSKLKAAMDTAASVTDFDVRWNEPPFGGNWTIKKNAGTFQIIAAGNTLMAYLGYTASDKTGALFYTGNRSGNTAEVVTVNTQSTGPGLTDLCLCVLGHNFTPSSVVQIQASTDNFASIAWSVTLTYGAYACMAYTSQITRQYYRVVVSDPTNPDGRIYFGRFGVFGYVESDHYETFAATIASTNRTSSQESDGGQFMATRRVRIAEPIYNLEFMSDEKKAEFDAFLAVVGNWKPFLLTLAPDNPTTTSLWCLFKGEEPAYTRIKGKPTSSSAQVYSFNVQISVREQK